MWFQSEIIQVKGRIKNNLPVQGIFKLCLLLGIYEWQWVDFVSIF